MRTKKEIVNKISELYTLMKDEKLDPVRTIVYTDALMWTMGEDYLDQYVCNYKGLYENKKSEVETLYKIIQHIHYELSLLKLKECPEEEFKNIPLEICDWIEELNFIKKETELGIK